MIIAIIIIGIFFICAFWHGLVTRRYIIYSDKIKNKIKIVLITDLHSRVFGRNQKNIISKIKKSDPDIILLGGDIYDFMASVSKEGVNQLIDGIKNTAPVYYITGNHDMVLSRREPQLKEDIAARGITVLDNRYEKLNIHGNKLIIGGVDDPGSNRKFDPTEYQQELETSWEENISSYFNGLEHDKSYKILLSHRPEKTTIYAKLPFDLILSGHAHGGQWRVPFILNGLFAPQQGFFPKYAGGLHKYAGKTHIISRGACVHLLPPLILPRIFNPPEVVSIEIKPYIPSK